MSRLEREAREYQRGQRTHSELVWDAWTTAKEDSHGIADRVEVLRIYLSDSAFAAVQKASRRMLATMLVEATGFLPHCYSSPRTGMELLPEFVPRTFINGIAGAGK